MSQLVIIAGPQAAGKSTVVTKLTSQPYNIAPLFPNGKVPLLFPLQESRQIISHMHMLLGAIYMTSKHEEEVIQCDLKRMDLIIKEAKGRLVHVDECNIFTIAHAKAHGIQEVEKYWGEYIDHLAQLKATVIFLDVPPDISWDRRRRRYEQRLVYFPEEQHEEILLRYREYLENLYPLLHKVYQRLPFPKVQIDGRQAEHNVLTEVCRQMVKLTKGFT